MIGRYNIHKNAWEIGNWINGRFYVFATVLIGEKIVWTLKN